MKAVTDKQTRMVKFLEGAPPETMSELLKDDPSMACVLLEFAMLEQACTELPIAVSSLESLKSRRAGPRWVMAGAAAAVVLVSLALFWLAADPSPGTAEALPGMEPAVMAEQGSPHPFSLPWDFSHPAALPLFVDRFVSRDIEAVSLTGRVPQLFPPFAEISLYGEPRLLEKPLTYAPWL